MPGDAERKVESRIAQARIDAETAADIVEATSRTKLDALLARPVAERFAAIESADHDLAPHHRRALLRSIREGSKPTLKSRATSIPTASRWEILRSRLPYRVVPLAVAGLLVITSFVLVVVARQRTPERWVEFAGQQDAAIRWRQPNDLLMDGRLVAGRSYALMRRLGSDVVLREWVPGQGYAETQVPRAWLDQTQRR